MYLQTMAKEVKTTRLKNAVAAGTTTQTATIDMRGFMGLQVEVLFGTLTSTTAPVVSVGSGTASNGSDAASITGASVTLDDTASNKIAIVDILNAMPAGHYYATVSVTRPTANAVIDGIIAHQYNPRTAPVTQDATTVVGTALVASS